MVTTSRGWLEFRVPSCQRVIVLFILVIRVKCVVWIFLKLGVLRGGGLLEAEIMEESHVVSQKNNNNNSSLRIK